MTSKPTSKWPKFVLGFGATASAGVVFWFVPGWLPWHRYPWSPYADYFCVLMVWVILLRLVSGPTGEQKEAPACTCASKECRRCKKRAQQPCNCDCATCKQCKEHHHSHAIAPVFQIIWWMWAAAVIVCEFLVPAIASVSNAYPLTDENTSRIWFGLVLWFLVVEIYAAVWRRRIGDTFSEHVWAFIHHEIARAGIAVGIILLLIVRIVELGVEPTTILDDLDLGRTMLGIGFGGWVIYHFVDREMRRRRGMDR